jgi:hypothetical protein
MSDNKKESGLWGLIGKAGVIIALIWGAIQIYNFFFKTQDYSAEAKGNHSFYDTSPIHLEGFNKNIDNQALIKTIIERDGSLKSFHLDTLFAKYQNSEDFKSNRIVLEGSDWETKFVSIWTFNIKNTGNKPLDELALEVPFKGAYKIVLPNNTSKTGNFNNQISIGELRPSYEVQIICWTVYESYDLESFENKSRFTHKNGWFSIKYPIEVSGFIAWNERNDNLPLFGIVFILLILFFVSFALGEKTGKKEMLDKIKTEKIGEEVSQKLEKDKTSNNLG